MFLTQREQAANVDPTDFIHIVKTGDTSQNVAGSSYKAQINQIFELTASCCLSFGEFNNGTLTLFDLNGDPSFEVLNIKFTGGSGNCINNLYVNNIHPCVTNIRIQPLSVGNTYFGQLSGFTVDHTSNPGSTRVGLNTNTPEHTFDFFSYDGRSRYYYDEDPGGLHAITMSGDSSIVTVTGVFSETGSVGLTLNIRGSGNTTYEKIGAQGDTCLYSSTNSRGLNIITQVSNPNVNLPEYIRFYAGTDVQASGGQPHIHIQGDGDNQGFMGIGQGNTNPTSMVDISGTTGYNQLRLRTAYVPSSGADANGQIGDICWGLEGGVSPYIYLKTSSGWKKGFLNGF